MMNTTTTTTTTVLILSLFTAAAAASLLLINTSYYDEVFATGGAGEIKELIDPLIDRAIEALQNNNTELALEEIETLKNELQDTFEADKED